MEDLPLLSVILPVYNAMPWLPVAIRDVMKQRLPYNQTLELLVAFDGGEDGSLTFLIALVSELGQNRASYEVCETPSDVASSNPAFAQPLRASETIDHPSFAACSAHAVDCTLTVAEVASACRLEHRLRLLRYSDCINRGQGAAMSLALAKSRSSPYLAQMESDDERGTEEAYERMILELEAHPDWDGISCQVQLIGCERPGMEGYVAWQNSLCSAEAMAAGRFIEQPALHQTAIFRRSAVDDVLAQTNGRYRDGVYRPLSSGQPSGSVLAADLDVPVDLWWWLTYFHMHKTCGKLTGEALFGWRQHPRQHTRTHGRLSLDNLRLIKAYYFAIGPAHGASEVQVWSTGRTLDGWVGDLAAAGVAGITPVNWKPGSPLPTIWRSNGKRKAAGLDGSRAGILRIFVFGKEKAREKVRASVLDWDDCWDWFAA